MNGNHFLIVTAIAEAGTGLLILSCPSVPVEVLLGIKDVSPEVTICARIAGAALLGIGVACWIGRSDTHSSAQLGLLTGALIYDLAAAAILAYAGLILSMVGIILWPAVMLHGGLAVWCIACFAKRGSKAI
jgi:hypothetical protein